MFGTIFTQKPKLEHNRKLDDLRTGFEIAEGYWIGHAQKATLHIVVRQGGLF